MQGRKRPNTIGKASSTSKPVFNASNLRRVPVEQVNAVYERFQPDSRPSAVYVDRSGWVVMVYDNATPACEGTPWAGTLRVAVKHSAAKTLEAYNSRRPQDTVGWDELQSIKDRFWPDRIAIEVFPPKSAIVNVADMRWLWVLPPGAILPLNLQASRETMES